VINRVEGELLVTLQTRTLPDYDKRLIVQGDLVEQRIWAGRRRAKISECDHELLVGSTNGIEKSLRLSVLSSGSSGNATYIESSAGGLLVDAGLPCRRIEALLACVGRSLDDVGAVLLTHGHADHTLGVRSLVREYGVEVFAAPGAGECLNATTTAAGEAFEVCGLSAIFFEVPHYSSTYGLHLSNGERDVAMATDLGEAGQEVLRYMSGAEAVVLEANHDPDWLRSGPYSARLKRRISSTSGHLSNRQAAEVALALAPLGLKDLVLAHLSKTNNSPARACGTVHKALREAGYGGIRVRAALAGHPTPWVEAGAPLKASKYLYRYAAEGEVCQLFEIE
jgi:phosphoribosyl 1,2-cyclic phosphodiesterase